MSNNDTVIENRELLSGCYHALKNAEHFSTTAESLYSQKNYQASIAISTISIEETLKAYELIRRFHQGNNITNNDWQDIKNHKFKLTHTFYDLINGFKKIDIDSLGKLKENMEKIGLPYETDKNKIIEGLEEKSFIYSHFKYLRESCLYVDWNNITGTWTGFAKDDTIGSLAFFMMKEAQFILIHLKSRVERVINQFREQGKLLIEVPFPTYTEHRKTENHESTSLTRDFMSKLDKTKMEQGLKAFKKFVFTKNIDLISPTLLQERILEYIKQLMKQGEAFTHPIFKALMIALTKSDEHEENVGAYSDDSDSTNDGKPYMSFMAIVTKENNNHQIKEITDLKNPNYKFDNAVLERILRTELVLERKEGKDVSISIFIEALSKIGVKAKVLKATDIPDAIKYTKEYIISNRIERNQFFTPEVAEEIKSLTDIDQWESISSISRTTIAIVYGREKYPGFSIYIVPSERIEKYKCRMTILDIIQKNYIGII